MTERGEPRHPGLAALGLVLAAVAVTLPWTARAVVDRSPSGVDRAVAVPEVAVAPSSEAAYAVAPEPTIASPARLRPAPGVPLRLIVPSLQVDAPVVPIGAAGGVLLPPGDPQTLGWWSAGARPGAATGGALITGHTVHTGGGAFDDLDTMDAGDVVKVRTPRGVLEYAVSEVTVYRKATLARDAERVFSQSVPGRLVLITCEDWNGTGYDSNAVVVAHRI
jgi:LPXTG-site transpeptidase (sortase) family protein